LGIDLRGINGVLLAQTKNESQTLTKLCWREKREGNCCFFIGAENGRDKADLGVLDILWVSL